MNWVVLHINNISGLCLINSFLLLPHYCSMTSEWFLSDTSLSCLQMEAAGNLLLFVLYGTVIWSVVSIYLLICVYLLYTLHCRIQKEENHIENNDFGWHLIISLHCSHLSLVSVVVGLVKITVGYLLCFFLLTDHLKLTSFFLLVLYI